MIAFCCIIFGGCQGGIKGDRTYYQYQYDMTKARFVKYGASIYFDKKLKNYTYYYGDGLLNISGSVSKNSKPDSYIISCSESVVPLVINRYRDYLVNKGASSAEIESFDTYSASFKPTQQFFTYDKYLFTGSAIEMSHVADSQSSNIEGEYIISSTHDLLKFSNGNLYKKDDNDQYAITGYYSVSNGMLTVTTTENGKDKYVNGILARKRYLIAKISFDKNGFSVIGTDFNEAMQDSEWVKILNDSLNTYSGKTITVFVNSFFAA